MVVSRRHPPFSIKATTASAQKRYEKLRDENSDIERGTVYLEENPVLLRPCVEEVQFPVGNIVHNVLLEDIQLQALQATHAASQTINPQ